MKKYSLGVSVETLLDSVGHKVELGTTVQLHIYADYGEMEDEIFFHDGRLIMHITEGTVLHCSVNDVTKSVRVVNAGNDLFKLEFADFNPCTRDEQGVICCPPEKVELFEQDWKLITQGNPNVKVAEREVAAVSPKVS